MTENTEYQKADREQNWRENLREYPAAFIDAPTTDKIAEYSFEGLARAHVSAMLQLRYAVVYEKPQEHRENIIHYIDTVEMSMDVKLDHMLETQVAKQGLNDPLFYRKLNQDDFAQYGDTLDDMIAVHEQLEQQRDVILNHLPGTAREQFTAPQQQLEAIDYNIVQLQAYLQKM